MVSGTRPEIIKLAPLYHALREADFAPVRWLHTGQHDEMARQIMACFDITPDAWRHRAPACNSARGVGPRSMPLWCNGRGRL